MQMPHPGTTPKLYFPLKKLQIIYLWEISINLLIKTREAPKVNRPYLLVMIIAKMITCIYLINYNDRIVNLNFNNTFS